MISLVIPIYNEESVIPVLHERTQHVLNSSGMDYEILYIDDGSRDNSFNILKDFYQKNRRTIRIIRLTRNFGHQMAIAAGLKYSKGEAAIIMDGDLQDPPEIILEFIKRWEDGHSFVYGVRQKRQGESVFKIALIKNEVTHWPGLYRLSDY